MNRLSLKLNLHMWLKVLTNKDCWDVYPVIISNKCWCHDRFVVQDRQNRTWGFTVKTWLAHAEVMVDPALPVESFFLIPPFHRHQRWSKSGEFRTKLWRCEYRANLLFCGRSLCIYHYENMYCFTTIWKTNKSRIVCI